MNAPLILTEIKSDNVIAAFFGKNSGVSEEVKYGGPNGLNTARTSSDTKENIEKNEQIVIKQFGDPEKITLCPVISGYSDKIVILESAENTIADLCADAIITKQKNALITTQTADAVPVLLSGKNKKGEDIIAAASCPHTSLKLDILINIVQTMIDMGSLVESIQAYIGPGLRKESFEVSSDFKNSWIKKNKDYKQFFNIKDEAHDNFDMPGVEKFQLTNIGGLGENIYDCGIDIGSPDQQNNYHSFRGMKVGDIIQGKDGKFGRNTSAIMIIDRTDGIHSKTI